MRLNYIFMENQVMNTNYLYLHPGLFLMQGKPVGEPQSRLQQQESIYFSVSNYIDRIINLVRFHLACACIDN